MNKPDEKTTNLAKKIKALADQGIGGEKEAARRMLEQYMKKHGITDEMLEDQREVLIEYKHVPPGSEERKILGQVYWAVTGKERGLKDSRFRNSMFLKAKAEDQIEIQARFEFYKSQWKIEKEKMMAAFINYHHIFHPEVETVRVSSKADIEKLEKIQSLIKGMEQTKFLKTIENK